MPRIDHTVQAAPGKWPSAGGLLVWLGADTVNKEQFPLTGQELVLAWNTGASGRTITIDSSADPYGRSGPITAEAIAAGDIRMFGPFDIVGWAQSDGNLHFEGNHLEVEFAVISLPALKG